MKRILVTMFSLMVLTACSSNEAGNTENDQLKVTTTIAQIADGIEHIGGEHVEVNSLMGPGTDPHLYKATQSDISLLQDADLIMYNGLHLEGKMLEVLEKMGEKTTVVAVGDSLEPSNLLADKDNQNAVDPHIWFDIDLWIEALTTAKDALIEVDPENKDDYEANAEAYFTELRELKAYATEQIHLIPEEKRVLVTAHDAFNYFGNAYDMEVMGLQGLSTDAEYGLGDVQHLVNTIADREINAVFVESSISERSINAVIEGAKEKGHTVSIGGELYSDAMGEEGTELGTYVGMYKHNVDTIVQSLK
ncbi:metal ABC transporter solute-binding protein, Zn/Mn family [Cytobacillus kochii]|uniref:metal ABC transporter solute-binding protein, Zn/Mn family n=1 Tax=Cytobacillus kochii TaxID=859143 RepID=UPI001CD296F4|nr:zinc ABC transporter substrate-binding protein [Cytobacillus kochii]MCA1027199.1 zinc ABC transporter substrate-binding protein [Cytobacillus kochii]MCM3320867.1 zinc ABC transporter substrate-binding protein [Cytobacillus kochii]MCM3344300.1 zinc ABC transporter substrate-binding protein [Cytobacillus kochii]MDM5208145.1 zinc ABC transporter substrate-binding protein [Cytobacillus kochii]